MNRFEVGLYWPDEHEAKTRPVYDALIGSVGFEQRARFIPLTLKDHAREHYASEFRSRKVLNHAQNLLLLKEHGYEILEQDAGEFAGWFTNLLEGYWDRDVAEPRLCVDISSMSRARIAGVIAALGLAPLRGNVAVDFLYAPARYGPQEAEGAPVLRSAPVLPAFAGSPESPDTPSVALLGIGYEREKALGAMEFLEPADVWVFVPTGEDRRYDRALRKAKEPLWEGIPENQTIPYRVDRPDLCFQTLESLVYGLGQESRPVIVPLGPKIFAMTALLVALLHSPNVAVWRVSSGALENAIDRVANGRIRGLTTLFKPGEMGA